MKLVMTFVNQSSTFVHGFECGQIWEWCKSGKPFNNYLFHSINKQQVVMMLDKYGYEYSIELVDNTWSTIYFGSNKSELN